MIQPMAGGRRRIDRVLAPDFLDDVHTIDNERLRAKRLDAEQEEVDLSFVRRMLQGRIDIVRAELAGRHGQEAEGDIVERLVKVLGSEQRTTRGLGRHLNLEPTRVSETRRAVEQLIADAELSDVTHRSDAELEAGLLRLLDFERQVSDVRRQVQDTIGVLSAELADRYRDGRASVDSLLEDQG